MKLESHLPRQSPWLYIAPLLTAILLLLVYFLLSSGFIAQSGVSVRLPESPARLAGFETAHVITLAHGDPYRLFLDGRSLQRDELREALNREHNAGRKALIQADHRIPFGLVMEISQVALSAHYEVAYATTPPASVASQP